MFWNRLQRATTLEDKNVDPCQKGQEYKHQEHALNGVHQGQAPIAATV